VPGEEPEDDLTVRLAAAHRLLQRENRLASRAIEAGQAPLYEVAHAGGHVCSLQERGRIGGIGGKTLGDVFDLLVEPEIQNGGIDLAGVSDCLQHALLRTSRTGRLADNILASAKNHETILKN
jgi:hypothetical protein